MFQVAAGTMVPDWPYAHVEGGERAGLEVAIDDQILAKARRTRAANE
jgi:hypothetical protein